MHDKNRHPRKAVVAIAATSMLLLAACGEDPQPAAGTEETGGSETGTTATLVFSPLALKIPAMQGLAQGVEQYAPTKGFEVTVQDPDLNPQKQATDLQAVIESGKADAVWVIAVQPAALAGVVKTAQDKGVVMLLNGVPEDYGLSGMQPGITFENIQYAEQGNAIGEELGNCINEKLDGKAQVIFEENAPGTAGKEELETAAKEALAATAPGAEIVATIVASDRAQVQTDIGSALQGNPDVRPCSATTTRAPSALSAPSRPPARSSLASPRPAATRRSWPRSRAGHLRLGRPAVRGRHGPGRRRPRRPARGPHRGRRADQRPAEGHQGRRLTCGSACRGSMG